MTPHTGSMPDVPASASKSHAATAADVNTMPEQTGSSVLPPMPATIPSATNLAPNNDSDIVAGSDAFSVSEDDDHIVLLQRLFPDGSKEELDQIHQNNLKRVRSRKQTSIKDASHIDHRDQHQIKGPRRSKM